MTCPPKNASAGISQPADCKLLHRDNECELLTAETRAATPTGQGLPRPQKLCDAAGRVFAEGGPFPSSSLRNGGRCTGSFPKVRTQFRPGKGGSRPNSSHSCKADTPRTEDTALFEQLYHFRGTALPRVLADQKKKDVS